MRLPQALKKGAHLYLTRHASVSPEAHDDDEVNEARRVDAKEAAGILAFKRERKALEEALEKLEKLGGGAGGG